MGNTRYKSGRGLTIIELVVTVVIILVVMPTVGVLLVAGHRAWSNTYKSAHKKIKQDSQAVILAFGNMGRKSNRLSYTIYDVEYGNFTAAEPTGAEEEEVVFGDAVEFRYWDVGLDSKDSHKLMDITKTATAYSLFYIDGDKLKIDRGPYPPGAVPANGGEKNDEDVTTTVLAENVSTDPNGAFSHTTLNGAGEGAVRINITLTDPEDGGTTKVMTATLMRNVWPR